MGLNVSNYNQTEKELIQVTFEHITIFYGQKKKKYLLSIVLLVVIYIKILKLFYCRHCK